MIATAALTAACGGDGGGSTSSGEKITLRVSTFGKFGYTDLYKQYMKDHPNVTVVETAEGDLGKYNTQLIQRMAAGSGAGDVVAIEEGQVVNFLQSADKFVN
ncbi:MAG: carbohydrate ABC transporter substrate-binding protein, partial [Pedococcus sp.]